MHKIYKNNNNLGNYCFVSQYGLKRKQVALKQFKIFTIFDINKQ